MPTQAADDHALEIRTNSGEENSILQPPVDVRNEVSPNLLKFTQKSQNLVEIYSKLIWNLLNIYSKFTWNLLEHHRIYSKFTRNLLGIYSDLRIFPEFTWNCEIYCEFYRISGIYSEFTQICEIYSKFVPETAMCLPSLTSAAQPDMRLDLGKKRGDIEKLKAEKIDSRGSTKAQLSSHTHESAQNHFLSVLLFSGIWGKFWLDAKRLNR